MVKVIKDIDGDELLIDCGNNVMQEFKVRGAVMHIGAHSGMLFNHQQSAQLGALALSAAGIDIVGAARKVGELRAARPYIPRSKATLGGYDEFDLALDALAAELDKLDGR